MATLRDKTKAAPPLDIKTARKNAETYIEQATGPKAQWAVKPEGDRRDLLHFFQKLDPQKTKSLYNSEWLNKINLRDFLTEIASKFTVARQLERQDFHARYKAGKPVGLHEFLYPLIQAYDSLHLKADVELGGTDQIFNLLLGRELQKQNGQSPQVVISLPLLEGLDGARKMSKSFDNFIGFKDSPKDIYGKSMKISDDLLIRWIQIFTEGKRDLKKAFEEKNRPAQTGEGKLGPCLGFRLSRGGGSRQGAGGVFPDFCQKGAALSYP